MKHVRLVVIVLLLAVPSVASADWAQDGKLIAAQPDWEDGVAALADGAGGVFLAWMDLSTGEYDIYAQRLAPEQHAKAHLVAVGQGELDGPARGTQRQLDADHGP